MKRNIFVLTGAGVSAESGLGTFRDKTGEGIWGRFDPMKLSSIDAFESNPETVLAFYDLRRRDMRDAKPNAAHFALARLAATLSQRGGALTLVTQNIDNLHEQAGSRDVIHMHGELLKARCELCGKLSDWLDDLHVADVMRPHVVWFGEMPLYMDDIERALRHADLFVAIGTSGAVYPAAGFVLEARAMGIETCEINLESADNAALFDDCRYGPASETVPAWVEDILSR
jgi:NAD-dependent deacetylase